MKNILLYFSLLVYSSLLFGQSLSEKKSTAANNVFILKKEFVIPNLNNSSRKIWVYLPPNYNSSSKKYPVIYMHDAQNLFDTYTSYAGEWEVDETLNKLYNTTKKGFIVVAIENGGTERINEYTPWEHQKYGGGKGEIYINFIKNTLKPYIDKTYKTKPQPKHTALIGSSLGGLISYYGGLKYPKTFGKIGALSTSFWFSNKVAHFTKLYGKNNTSKLYLLIGEKEGKNMIEDTQKMKKLLIESGFNTKNIKVKINPDGAHNEAFWKSEFSTVVKWLFNLK